MVNRPRSRSIDTRVPCHRRVPAHIYVAFGGIWGVFRVILGVIWVNFRVILGVIWGIFRVNLGVIWGILRVIEGHLLMEVARRLSVGVDAVI